MIWPEGRDGGIPLVKTLEALIIAAGTVIAIGDTGVTLVRHRKAFLFVNWFGDSVPPAVRMGAHVGLIGKVRTFNNGQRVQVRDALLLAKSPKFVINALMKVLPEAVVNPTDYLTDREIEELTQPWE